MIIEAKPMLERTRKAYKLLLEDEKRQLYHSAKGEELENHSVEIECANSMIVAIDNELKNKHEA